MYVMVWRIVFVVMVDSQYLWPRGGLLLDYHSVEAPYKVHDPKKGGQWKKFNEKDQNLMQGREGRGGEGENNCDRIYMWK